MKGKIVIFFKQDIIESVPRCPDEWMPCPRFRSLHEIEIMEEWKIRKMHIAHVKVVNNPIQCYLVQWANAPAANTACSSSSRKIQKRFSNFQQRWARIRIRLRNRWMSLDVAQRCYVYVLYFRKFWVSLLIKVKITNFNLSKYKQIRWKFEKFSHPTYDVIRQVMDVEILEEEATPSSDRRTGSSSNVFAVPSPKTPPLSVSRNLTSGSRTSEDSNVKSLYQVISHSPILPFHILVKSP